MNVSGRTIPLAFAVAAFAMPVAVSANITAPTNAQLTAFGNANGSGSQSCQTMMEGGKAITKAGQHTNETIWKVTAAAANICLATLRENGVSRSAQAPARFVLLISCHWIDNNAESQIKACEGVPTQ